MEARRTRKIMFYLKFARHGGLLHEHELYEMLRSRKLYNVQCDLRRHLQRTIKSLECDERVSMAAHEARRTHFLQSTARRERAKTSLIKVKDFFPEGVNGDGSLGSANSSEEVAILETTAAKRNRQLESVDLSMSSETYVDVSSRGGENDGESKDVSVVFKTRLPDSHRKNRSSTIEYADPSFPSTSAQRAPSTNPIELRHVEGDQSEILKREEIADRHVDLTYPHSTVKLSSNGRSAKNFTRGHQYKRDHAIVVKTIPLRKVPTTHLSHEEVMDFVKGSQCSCDECVSARDRGRKQFDFWWGRPSRKTTTLPPLPEKALIRDSSSPLETGPEHRHHPNARSNTSDSDLVESTERFKALRLSRLEDVRRRSRDLNRLVAQFRLR